MRIASRHAVAFGGDAPVGWLPSGAALPQATDRQTVLLDIELNPESGGFLLVWRPSPGQQVSAEPPFASDLWYQELSDALANLKTKFGIEVLQKWRVRRGPVAVIRNGLESPYYGSVDALVTGTKAVTLLTLGGHEVQVQMLRRAEDGYWYAQVVRSEAGADSPALGALVRFGREHVQAGTI